MAKLKVKGAPVAPKPAPAAQKRAGWSYYVVPPLLIIGVFLYCSKHAHKAPAPAQPAVAAAPAAQPQAEPQAEPQPAADNVEPAATGQVPEESAEPTVQEPANAEQDDDFTGEDTTAPDTPEKEPIEEE